ncbi:ABC transporter permease [Alicyclobacillus sp. SO9]|nr:ABC transporter permease [Alicyclobacillus sp. SO9]
MTESGHAIKVVGTDVEKVKIGMTENQRRRVLAVVSPIILLVIWQFLSQFHLIDTRFFPTPTSIIAKGISDIQTGQLQHDLVVSLYRIFWGFIGGAVPGVIIGVSMGLFPIVRAIFDPVVSATYPIPKLALLPLIMLIFGLGNLEKIMIILLGVVFPVLINSAAGVLNLEKAYMDVAKNFGASRWNYYKTVAIPGSLPMIFTGLKLGSGMALLLIVAAEMEGSTAGIGYRIWTSYDVFDIRDMFVYFILMSLLGYIFSIILDEIEARVVPWKQK